MEDLGLRSGVAPPTRVPRALSTETTAPPLILIADDDLVMRLVLRQALEQSGFGVVGVEDGAAALESFEVLRPNLIILDVMMPRMDGFEACARLRKTRGGDTVPILMLTGLDDIESVHRAYEVGATDFASKPMSWALLGHRVRYMLRAARTLLDLREGERLLARAQTIARMGHWERHVGSGRFAWSAEAHALFGTCPTEHRPSFADMLARVHPGDRDAFETLLGETERDGTPSRLDLRIVLPDGSLRFVHQHAERICDEDCGASRVVATVQDISERKASEDQIRFLAYHDALTQLPNRTLFAEWLAAAIARAARQPLKVAALLVDLDQFKRINDTLGHGLGDQLIKDVAERLKSSLRASDTLARGGADPSLALARPGGDEFLVAVTDIARADEAAKIAKRILETLVDPFNLGGHEVYLTGSIGISVYPEDGSDAEALLARADTAMYDAKRSGWGNYKFYDPAINAAAADKLALEVKLRHAVERGELQLVFQPQVDGATGAVVGAEALMRWHHPELGLVMPGSFIPLAEETGLIVPLGAWLIRAACEELGLWQEAGHGDLTLSLNVSSRQFRQQQLVRQFRDAIAATGADPRRLAIEITEGTLMQGDADTLATLDTLEQLGVRIFLDDFGTGYSSLSYLKRFPVDALKIDKSFVRDIASDPDDAAITTAIIALSQSLKLDSIAEGVETADQAAFLRGRGCTHMQGYHFGRPVPASEFAGLLADRVPPGLATRPDAERAARGTFVPAGAVAAGTEQRA